MQFVLQGVASEQRSWHNHSANPPPAGVLLMLTAILLTLLPGADPVVPAYPDHAKLMVYRDADGTEHPVRTPDDWRKRRAHILAHMQTVMGPLPGPERKVPLDPQIVEEVKTDTFIRRK